MATSPEVDIIVVTAHLENRPGELGRAAQALAAANINIEAISVDGSAARLVPVDPGAAVAALEAGGFRAAATPFVCVRLPNAPGQLARLGEELGKSGVNIEVLFAVPGTRESSRVFLQVSDVARARPVLERLSRDTAKTLGRVRARP